METTEDRDAQAPEHIRPPRCSSSTKTTWPTWSMALRGGQPPPRCADLCLRHVEPALSGFVWADMWRAHSLGCTVRLLTTNDIVCSLPFRLLCVSHLTRLSYDVPQSTVKRERYTMIWAKWFGSLRTCRRVKRATLRVLARFSSLSRSQEHAAKQSRLRFAGPALKPCSSSQLMLCPLQ